MDKPKEIWVIDISDFKVIGPCTVVGESDSGNYWKYTHDRSIFIHFVAKSETILTRKQAVIACYEYHEKLIKQSQKELNKRKQLLKEFYSEELYE